MLFRSARGVAASVATVFVAELLLFVFMADRFGPLIVTLVSVAASVIGLRYLVRFAPGAVARSFQDVADVALGRESLDEPTDLALADRALKMAAAILLAFPGLITGFLGSVLFVGPVRRLLAKSLGSRLLSLIPAATLNGHSFQRRRAAVDAKSTVKDPARPPASSARNAHANELPR